MYYLHRSLSRLSVGFTVVRGILFKPSFVWSSYLEVGTTGSQLGIHGLYVNSSFSKVKMQRTSFYSSKTTTLIIPFSAYYYAELRSVIMSYSGVHF